MFKSNRCTIKRFDKGDIEGLMQYRNNVSWMQYQSFKCLSELEFQDALINDNTFNEGLQLAIKNSDNMIIGDLYGKNESEGFWIGYTIHPDYSKQGYTYEVVLAFINYIKTHKLNKVLLAGVVKENVASINLLLKLGFNFDHHDAECNEDIYKKVIN